MNDYLDTAFYGNSLAVWLLAAAVAVVAFIVLYIMRGIIAVRLRAAAPADAGLANAFLGIVHRPWFPIILVAALYAGSYFLTLPDSLRNLATTIVVIALLLQVAIWGSHVASGLIAYARREREAKNIAGTTALHLIQIIVKTVIWSFAALLILDNLGIDITAMVAGLGIGGIAVALAAQNILSDLFASLSIVFDKPFEVGDFLIFDDYLGTVQHIGLKTTRIRSLSGEEIVVANADLLGTRIRNYKRMLERRILFTIGVTYGTPYEKVERIPGMIREIIEAQPNTRFDRSHFKSYGDFSLDIETVYYMQVPDYNSYMDTQQAVNLALYKRFEGEGIEFAFPTRTLHLHHEEQPGGAAVSPDTTA